MILAGIYLAYYGLNLVFDLLNAKERGPSGSDDDEDVLYFSQEEPELIVPEEKVSDADLLSGLSSGEAGMETAGNVGSSVKGTLSTALSLKELFALAKDDLIEYTRAISY